MKVGVISDTHGLLRAEALAALEGCEWVIHAGDIGKLEILEQQASIAPLHVVRGTAEIQPDGDAGAA
jgi:predicted phosphodiesterase